MEACSPTTQPLIWTGEPIILICHYRTYCELSLRIWLGLPQLVRLLLHHLLAMERWGQSKILRTLSFIKNLILFSFKVPSRPLSVIDFHGLNDKTIPYRSLSLFCKKNTNKVHVMWCLFCFLLLSSLSSFMFFVRQAQNFKKCNNLRKAKFHKLDTFETLKYQNHPIYRAATVLGTTLICSVNHFFVQKGGNFNF